MIAARELPITFLELLPRRLQIVLWLGVHWMVPGLRTIIPIPSRKMSTIYSLTTRETFYFPSPLRKNYLYKVAVNYPDKMYDKYTLDGFVTINSEDVVVDIGAYVGGFTTAASRRRGVQVVAVEPSDDNFACLQRNVGAHKSVDCLQALVFTENGEANLMLGKDPTDHSVINIDKGDHVGVQQVEAVTVARVLDIHDINQIDLLKIDAEGAEPEVVESALKCEVKKYAVDCGAERHGEETFGDVRNLLESDGYTVRREGDILYARYTEPS